MTSQAQAEESLSETNVKAGFLYNFMKFVEWPALEVSQPLTLCVAGTDEFGKLLNAFANKPINAHQIIIRRSVTAQTLQECHVVFIAQDSLVADVIGAAKQLSILTISDKSKFIERGGMIQLETRGQKVVFAINADAAAESGLKISSKLLALSVKK